MPVAHHSTNRAPSLHPLPFFSVDFAVCIGIAIFFKLQYFFMLMLRMKKASKIETPSAASKAPIESGKVAVNVVAVAGRTAGV